LRCNFHLQWIDSSFANSCDLCKRSKTNQSFKNSNSKLHIGSHQSHPLSFRLIPPTLKRSIVFRSPVSSILYPVLHVVEIKNLPSESLKPNSCMMDNEIIDPRKDWFYAKILLLVTFIAVAIYLNSKAEYEALQMDAETNVDKLSQLQMILFGCSILLQLAIASTLFLILCNIFPFQVGLWSPMLNSIPFLRWLKILQPVYIALGCIVGGMRLVRVPFRCFFFPLFTTMYCYIYYFQCLEPNICAR